MNYLTGLQMTEPPLIGQWNAESRPPATFDLARRYLSIELASHRIVVTRYHDLENPLPIFEIILSVLREGGVVIPSFELATAGPSGDLRRAARYHMLSIFNLQGENAEVWDTNNRVGFITIIELSRFLTGHDVAIPYHPLGYLVEHDQHEVLVISREDASSVGK